MKITQKAEKVFIGIDVHLRSYSVACVIDSEVVKKCRMKAGSLELLKFIQTYYPEQEIHTVYEAGFSGFGLHRALEEAGYKSIVINAGSVEVASGDRVKTDKRDATKLAIQLSAKRLRAIRIPTLEEESRRQITRTRQQLVGQRTRTKIQIRSKLHYFGLLDPDERREMSFKLVSEVLSRGVSRELDLVVNALVESWKSLDQQIKKLEKELRKQASTDPCEQVYRQLPGIGPLSARILSNEVGDLSQFTSCKQLYSYTGLTPSENSSGERIRRGSISRQGNPRLRHILVEAAWTAIRQDPGLRLDF